MLYKKEKKKTAKELASKMRAKGYQSGTYKTKDGWKTYSYKKKKK